MAPESTIQIPKLRCSPFHSSLEVDPIGTAASYDAYLCVDVPLPWQRDITMSEPFASLCDPPVASLVGGDGRRWRPQGLVPAEGGDHDEARSGARIRVTTWEQPRHRTVAPADGDSIVVGPLFRRDWCVDPDDMGAVVDLLRAILSDDPEAVDEYTDRLESIDDPALYVCSHGQRDVCCGSLGMEVYGGLDGLALSWPGEVRRCSHTGGHRFAATGITFPDGYAWAHLTPQLADAIAHRRVDPREVALHMRGSTLVPKGPSQAIDRLGLTEAGWAWADATRRITLVGFERRTMATDLRVTATLPDGVGRTYEARVVVDRFVPQITCGAIDRPEYDVEPIWKITDWREVDPL